jgi:Zn finger protein HypA/HybF involved in hydrogenase expression
MDITQKCSYCGKYYFVIEVQAKCPFCGKDEYTIFKDLFGEDNLLMD